MNDASTTIEQNNDEEKLDGKLTSPPLFAFISNIEIHPPSELIQNQRFQEHRTTSKQPTGKNTGAHWTNNFRPRISRVQ